MRRAARGAAVVLVLGALARLAPAQVRDWPSERPPEPLPARDVRFPPYALRTLDNGLRVVAVSHHEQPAITLRLIVGAGAAYDPPDKPGVANLVALLLDQGTTTRSAQAIARAIDDIGGVLATGAATDLIFVNAVVMKDSFDLGLDLVADVVRHPVFAPEEIERQREQVLSTLQVSYEDPDYIAGVVFDRLVYGFHPYGRPASGTPQSVARITREDLVAFHTRYFAPNNAILAVVGDVTADEAFAGVARAFGSWARRDVTPPAVDDPPPPTRRVVVIDRPGAVQTEIRVGHVGLPRRHPDYLALNMAVRVLGGEGANRLQRVLRSERGLTYAASAELNALRQTGDLVAETDTRSEATGEVLRVVVDEFWRLRRERVNRGELQSAQDYLAGSFPLTIETPSAIALQVLNALFYDLDLAELETFPERVRAVTPGDIQRVAETYLRPDRLSIVLVGDADTFADQLRRVGFDTVERIPLAELDLSAADLRRRPAPSPWVRLRPAAFVAPGVRVQAAADPRALLERAVAAMGGIDRLRALKTLRATGTTAIAGPAGVVTVDTVTSVAYPNRFRVETTVPAGRVVQVFVDGEAWLQDPTGVRDAPAAMRDDLRAAVERDLVRLLLDAYEGRSRLDPVVEPGGPSGGGVHTVTLTLPSGQTVRVRLDAASGLVSAVDYTVPAPAGRRAQVEERFTDYRDVDGLRLAFGASVRRDGVVVMERTLQRVEVNVPFDAALFAKPVG